MEGFLLDFYNTISFKHGESFKDELFKALFLPNAILIENVDGIYVKKTVHEHIEQFNTTIRDYQQLFVKGFHEEQISYKVIESENCILISSTYQKTYSRNNEPVIEIGVNNMMLVLQNGEYKIASILW